MTASARQRLLTALLAFGYLFLLVDTLLEHRAEFAEHWQTWVPPITAALLTLVLGAAALRWGPAMARAAAVCLALSCLVGLLGFWFHIGEHLEEGGLGSIFQGPVLPPVMAPLSFAGLGVLGLGVLWGEWRGRGVLAEGQAQG